jgi:hypothetical protein
VDPSLLTNGSSGTVTAKVFVPLRSELQMLTRLAGSSGPHGFSVNGIPAAVAAASACA